MRRRQRLDLDAEFEGYIEAALEACSDASGEVPLSVTYSLLDVAPDAVATMEADLRAFLEEASLEVVDFWAAHLGAGAIGHDLWMAMSRDGAGSPGRPFPLHIAGHGGAIAYEEYLRSVARRGQERHLQVADDGWVRFAN